MKRAIVAAAGFGILILQPINGRAAEAEKRVGAVFPNPVLRFTTVEHYTTDGSNWVRHRYDVLNKNQYPKSLFAPAPLLPPCGMNSKSSRSWVDFFDSSGKRLYGFCSLAAKDLGSIWFATKEGIEPPRQVYIEITDRQTNTIYRSNLARTLPPIKTGRTSRW